MHSATAGIQVEGVRGVAESGNPLPRGDLWVNRDRAHCTGLVSTEVGWTDREGSADGREERGGQNVDTSAIS